MLQQLCDSIALLEEACRDCKWQPETVMPSVTLTFPTKAHAALFADQFRYEAGARSDVFKPLDKSTFLVRGVEIKLRWADKPRASFPNVYCDGL
jgi:hypothetical protein